MKTSWIVALVPFFVSGCAKDVGQNQYSYNEVGKSAIVEFATVISVKSVDVTGRNTGTGSTLGATAGGVSGYQFGNGNGQVGSAVAGALVGAVAGTAIEQAAAARKGYEYLIVTEHKETKTIVQNQNEGDVVFKKGDRVMLQTSGTYQRLLPTDGVPNEVKKPKNIKVTD